MASRCTTASPLANERHASNVLINLPLDDDGVVWFTACGHVIPGCGLGGTEGRGGDGGGAGGFGLFAAWLRSSRIPWYSNYGPSTCSIRFREWNGAITHIQRLWNQWFFGPRWFHGRWNARAFDSTRSFYQLPCFSGFSVTFPVSIPLECVELAQREGVAIKVIPPL